MFTGWPSTDTQRWCERQSTSVHADRLAGPGREGSAADGFRPRLWVGAIAVTRLNLAQSVRVQRCPAPRARSAAASRAGELALTSPTPGKRQHYAKQQQADERRLHAAIKTLTAKLHQAGATHL